MILLIYSLKPISKLTRFEISLILALAILASSDPRYFSISIALISAVDKFVNECADDSCSFIHRNGNVVIVKQIAKEVSLRKSG